MSRNVLGLKQNLFQTLLYQEKIFLGLILIKLIYFVMLEKLKKLLSFCLINYGVTFPIFSTINVKGKDAHPLFKFLGDKNQNGKFSAKPWWNFYKYIIGRDGKVVDYFVAYTYPDKKRVLNKIKEAIAQK